jgi:nicotinamide-nucleotide amidase
MIAEILVTGNEILTGEVIDSNTAYISQLLEEVGVEVVRHSGVGDDMEILVSIIKEIAMRADVAVVTGGLGPTIDDITREAAAKAADVELILNRSALSSIEKYFTERRRSMHPSNKKQALLPKGSESLLNSFGTAPGFQLEIGGCTFFFVPGVPFEMQKMLSDIVLPRITILQGDTKRIHLVKHISIFGLTESEIGGQLEGFTNQFEKIQLGIRSLFPEIHVKIHARGDDETKLQRQINRAFEWMTTKIGHKTFSVDGSSMEAVVGRLLLHKNATLAVAESCTGGLISHWLTNVPGSSNYFLFSGVTYSNESKERVLGVSSDILKQFGAVHEEAVKEMAECARRVSGAGYGLATSGIAGPDGGTAEKPVGTVCIGLSTPHSTKGFRFFFPFNSRSKNKRIFSMTALDMLRKELLDYKN